MNLRKILITGSLAFALGACSSLSSNETEEEISKNVSIYRYNQKIASIKGPFVVKKEKGYTSFAELSEDEEIKFKPILYQIDLSKNVYLDCQRDEFNGNEFSINFGLGTRILVPENLYTPNQICKTIGY